MNELQRRYTRLLRLYPRSYLQKRGDEMLATLLDASPGDRKRPTLADTADIAVHATQMRLGLSSDRFTGRVLEVAASPGLAIAAAVSFVLFLSTELYALLNHQYGLNLVIDGAGTSIVPRPHFGPFATTGAVIYVGWIAITAIALIWPARRRSLAVFGVVGTVTASIVGRAWFAPPRFSLVLVIIALALPAVVAPSTEFARRRLPEATLAFCASLLILAWGSRSLITGAMQLEPRPLHPLGSDYMMTVRSLGSMLYLIGILAAVGMLTLVVLRRPVEAGALGLLTSPWLFVAFAYHLESGRSIGIYLALLGTPMLLLAIAWAVDVSLPSSKRRGEMTPIS
jgi:hypothetical protein